jgi:hypothetical protein
MLTDARGNPEPWKPYTNVDDLTRDLDAGILKKEITFGTTDDEKCETCGSKVHFHPEVINGHTGWWRFIGNHVLGRAFVPHTPQDCLAMKRVQTELGVTMKTWGMTD